MSQAAAAAFLEAASKNANYFGLTGVKVIEHGKRWFICGDEFKPKDITELLLFFEPPTEEGPMKHITEIEVVREPDTGEASIIVDRVSVALIPLDAGEDRRAYNRRVDEIERAVRATVKRLADEETTDG